jgi:hypothetical protein
MIKEKLKRLPKALFDLFFFQSVTEMPRWLEIGYGVIAWGNLGVIAYAIFH